MSTNTAELETRQRPIDLSGAHLRGTDLSKTDLARADFSNANLDEIDLSGSNLEGANFSSATLRKANLAEANLSNANLTNSDLLGADFSNANLSGTDLSGANLSGTDFSNANMEEANFSMARHGKTCLVGTNLNTAQNLTWSNLLASRFNETTNLPDYLNEEDLFEILENLDNKSEWRNTYAGRLNDLLHKFSEISNSNPDHTVYEILLQSPMMSVRQPEE